MTVISNATDPGALTTTFVAEFAAPPVRVWQVWEDPRQLERWWGPPTWPATFTRHDLTPNGQSRYHMTGPKGEIAPGWWTTLEVEAPTRLLIADGFSQPDGEPDPYMPTMRLEVSFDAIDTGTRMTILTRFTDVEQLEKVAAMGMVEGMTGALGQIDALLGGNADHHCDTIENNTPQAIRPCLWFNNQAREAMDYYVEVFPNSRIISVENYPDEAHDEHFTGMSGKVLNGRFTLNGVDFVCLDGGPMFTFNESISFVIRCTDQDEIDRYWSKLSHVPESEQCGWCKDRFGISWQIIPSNMDQLLSRPEQIQTMMRQKKIVIAELENA